MGDISGKALLKRKGLCRKKRVAPVGKQLAGSVSKPFLNSIYTEIISNHNWSRLVLNYWAWLHSAVHSGSSLIQYLSVSLIWLRRAVEFRRCVVRSGPELPRLGKTKATLGLSAPHAQSTKQDFLHVTDYINRCFTSLGRIFQQELLDYCILSCSLQEKSQALSSL